jgi:hypothetical protein
VPIPGRMTRRTVTLALLLALAAPLFGAPSANASFIVTRDASRVSLIVDAHNVARVSFTARGRHWNSLWWGAMNARYPDPAHPNSQKKFHIDYSGGSGSFGVGYWKHMRNVCGRYTGPPLSMVLKACTMPNGDHWVLQQWRRLMPNGGYGTCPRGTCAVELRISHFKGALPDLWLKWNYSSRYTWGSGHRLDELYGRISYLGKGMYGFSATPAGAPTDSYGMLIWVDTYNSAWGRGWRRVNSFLPHGLSDGAFCDQLWPSRFGRVNSPGNGQRYRAFADGTNPLPVVKWEGPPPGNYPISADQTRAGLGNYTIVDWLRRPYRSQLAQALDQEQTIVSQGDPRGGHCKLW